MRSAVAVSSFIDFCALHGLPNPRIRLSRTFAPFYVKTLSGHQPLLTTRNIFLVSCPSESLKSLQRIVYRKMPKLKAEKKRACHGVVLGWLSFKLSTKFGEKLLEVIPKMWQSMAGGVSAACSTR
jgi:TATA-binding protein-associated factor